MSISRTWFLAVIGDGGFQRDRLEIARKRGCPKRGQVLAGSGEQLGRLVIVQRDGGCDVLGGGGVANNHGFAQNETVRAGVCAAARCCAAARARASRVRLAPPPPPCRVITAEAPCANAISAFEPARP